MASMKYHKDCKRWRVFWHVTLPNGEVDKGRKKRTIGLNNTAIEVLERAKSGNKVKVNELVFSRKDGKPLNRHTLYHYIEKACIEVGSDY